MKIQRGFRGKLDDHVSTEQPLLIRIKTEGDAVYDSCCFGVDTNEKLSDDRYMVFYNQPVSPNREITYTAQGNTADYQLSLASLPETIVKLVFTVSIDGNGTMGQIRSHQVQILQNGQVMLELQLTDSDFQEEKAIIGIEIYRKGVWRMSAVGRGFNGGLGDLLKSFGGEAIEDTKSTSAVNTSNALPLSENSEQQLTNRLMGKINLSKDKVNLEKHVVNLSKCMININQKNGIDLGNIMAKVVVALDYSGSMGSLYRNGTVQSTINRLVPLGLNFDDNGTIDVFLFQNDFRKMEDLSLSNYDNYVTSVISKSGYSMGGTNYAPVLKAIIEGNRTSRGLFKPSVYVPPIVDDGIPTFIIFITDGENADKLESDTVIRKSSEMNVFIQFIGIGNTSFKYLEKLDDMSGRKRDNTGFSKMADLKSADDQTLYANVLEQFSKWLKGMQ